MPDYKAPLQDMRFFLYDVLNVEEAYKKIPEYAAFSRDDYDPVLDEQAKFAEKVVAPLNPVGDKEGVQFKDGEVTLPKGWKESYDMYVENGWPLIGHEEEYGGAGLPQFIGTCFSEMLYSASYCWSMLPGLTTAAVRVVKTQASDEVKNLILDKMIRCQWYGTMCLTEAHCGTDLGLVRTKAEEDGKHYKISGSKIFISGGDHDAAENIVHLVLARLPGAPKGTKGISLFAVPKYKVKEDGSMGEFNKVTVSSIEHKMGIKASPTCVLNFEGSEGFIIGEPNKGLSYMFIMMNMARIGTGTQGLAVGEASYQGARDYAKDRLQMRSITGPKNPDGEADPIIVHPDIRRMLLTQRAIAEGGRALALYTTCLSDVNRKSEDKADAEKAGEILELITPILKAFLTETGVESSNLGMQVLGGHGYIWESGMEQLARDARIGPIYEGTTGIQALDLLGRKVLMNQGRSLKILTDEILEFCKENSGGEMATIAGPVQKKVEEWLGLTEKITAAAMQNPEEVGAASFDYIMYGGWVILGWFHARMAKAAMDQLASGKGDKEFCEAKVMLAKFYMARLLPRTDSHAVTMMSGAASLMDMPENLF